MSKIKLKRLLSIFILIILFTSLLTGCVENNSEDDNANDEEGIDFTFALLNGITKSISDYRGKIVLIDFMGANCQPCQLQMLVLKDLSEEYKDDIEVISIDVWIVLGETVNTMNQFIQLFANEGYDLDWVFGVDDTSGTLYYKYANNGVPTIYLLDENGNIYYSNVGYTEYSVLDNKIKELI